MTGMQIGSSMEEPEITSMVEGITLFVGEEASDLLLFNSFLNAWDSLYQSCPWATVYQSRQFVATWYQTYDQTYTPIIVQNVTSGRLMGLLTLAMDKTKTIVGAGDSQAEYQVWIADETFGETFGSQALNIVFNTFWRSKIQLRFIPENAPLRLIKEDVGLKRHLLIRSFKQPIMRINNAHITNELRKKNRREKVNRLKRIGKLEFERIFDCGDFFSVLEVLAIQFDFRKAAMFNCSFFLEDSRRKQFLLALFELDLLHSTVLKLNGEIIASNVGTIGNDCVHLQGINTHHPSYGRYSPGIIHFLFLGKLLGEEGISTFDLTPGDSAYKDELATEFRTTYELTVCSLYRHFAHHFEFALVEHFKKIGNKNGVKPSRFSELKRAAANWSNKIAHVKSLSWECLIKGLSRQIQFSDKIILYRREVSAISPQSKWLPLQKNSLKDLLCYHSSETWATRREFLSEAMRRFEVGQRVYTYSEDNCLMYCVWLSNKNVEIRTGGLSLDTDLADNIQLLQGLYCNVLVGEHNLIHFIESVIAEIRNDKAEFCLYAFADIREAKIVHALEKTGFTRDNY